MPVPESRRWPTAGLAEPCGPWLLFTVPWVSASSSRLPALHGQLPAEQARLTVAQKRMSSSLAPSFFFNSFLLLAHLKVIIWCPGKSNGNIAGIALSTLHSLHLIQPYEVRVILFLWSSFCRWGKGDTEECDNVPNHTANTRWSWDSHADSVTLRACPYPQIPTASLTSWRSVSLSHRGEGWNRTKKRDELSMQWESPRPVRLLILQLQYSYK